MKKGSKVLIEGSIQTRKWTGTDGKDNYSTEIVLPNFGGQLLLLDGNSAPADKGAATVAAPAQAHLSDEIPF